MARRLGLQARVMLLIGLAQLITLVVFGTISIRAVRESTDRMLQERLVMAQIIAQHADYVLQKNLAHLQDAASLNAGTPWPEAQRLWGQALRQLYFQSVFTNGVYITDQKGVILWNEPYQPALLGKDISAYPNVQDVLQYGKLAVSSAHTTETADRLLVTAIAPIRNVEGQIIGAIGGDADPTSLRFQREILWATSLGESGYVQLVDRNGIVIASSVAQQIFTDSNHGDYLGRLIETKHTTVGTCHECHGAATQRETEVMAFAPLTSAPWGAIVRQSEAEAMAPAHRLQGQIILFGVILLLFQLLFAWAGVQSVVRPIAVLTAASERVAGGDLTQPVPPLGQDEIGRLARTFEGMRVRLQASLERIKGWNLELEEQVRKRTQELEASLAENARLYAELQRKEAMRGELLRKVISAQEEERKRIARELHDDTSQMLAAVAMTLDRASLTYPANSEEVKGQLQTARQLTLGTMENVHRMILDLRPSVLDDLGLATALQWYAESRLQPLGVMVEVEMIGDEKRLPAQIETALFRIAQEAISNIARHAQAEHAAITLEYSKDRMIVEIED
ncbi:MAG: HAMP domain-containing protein, partial [Chloroflexi bacterium]|nr:HAMP domain-containing protein [Chloroflexota bacterium]